MTVFTLGENFRIQKNKERRKQAKDHTGIAFHFRNKMKYNTGYLFQ